MKTYKTLISEINLNAQEKAVIGRILVKKVNHPKFSQAFYFRGASNTPIAFLLKSGSAFKIFNLKDELVSSEDSLDSAKLRVFKLSALGESNDSDQINEAKITVTSMNENSHSKFTQNQLEKLNDLVSRGEMTAAQANVEKVKMARVQIVRGSLPASVRKALNDAVKKKELKHYPKKGLRPEVYFHPSFEHLAKQALADEEKNSIGAISKVFGINK